MGFRDDDEARLQRLDTLERELASTKNELEAAALRAAEVDDLRKSVVALTNERDSLKKGVDPAWSRRYVRLGVAAAFAVGGLVVALVVVALSVHHRDRDQAARIARAEADLASCEYTSEPLRDQRDQARAELGQIDAVHADEMAHVQALLNAARMNETGPGLLVIARIVSREGSVPEGVESTCVLAVRDLPREDCAAAVLCGGTQVFPFVEPTPDVTCASADGRGWRAGGDSRLARLDSRVSPESPALLAYDAHARTIEVRETGGRPFALHLVATDVQPYHIR